MKQFLKFARPLTAQFTSDDAPAWREFLSVLKQTEHPGFTGFQCLYWLSAGNHSGQGSLGYLLSSSSPYTPSLTESPQSLRDRDPDFEAAYEAISPLARYM
jgi:hypothetical protein